LGSKLVASFRDCRQRIEIVLLSNYGEAPHFVELLMGNLNLLLVNQLFGDNTV
jgi:hypothetical protein